MTTLPLAELPGIADGTPVHVRYGDDLQLTGRDDGALLLAFSASACW